MPDISKETFDKADVATQRRILFDISISTNEMLSKQVPVCQKRFEDIENGQTKWKLKTSGIAAGSGLLGGALVMLSKLAFWK